jgi:hypothetical protein
MIGKNKLAQAGVAMDSRVEVTDIKMPFFSMVWFMVKWAVASIPAIIILWFLFMLFGGLMGSFSRY